MEEKNKRVAHNRLTQEKVIEQFKDLHGDAFGYDNVIYTGTNNKVEIYCKKHKCFFKTTPKIHKKSEGCYYCGREKQIEKAKKSDENFIEELYNIYADDYDYSKINYINSKTDVEIICKKHTSFKKLPCELIQGHGCPKCKKEKSKYNNKKLFIEEDIKIFGKITDYSYIEEMGAKNKIKLKCIKHDCEFILSVSARLSGQKCPKCSAENYREIRTTPKEEYYRRANEAHDYKYTYNDDYITSAHAITFFCKEHGRQRRNSYDHLRGAGCKKCDENNLQKSDKLTREGYIKLANGRPTYLYLIKCSDENEDFYKIGKTFREINERFIFSNMPYNFELISKHEGGAEYIWDLEEDSHIKYKDYSYNPNKWFAGFSECYKLDLPIQEIINL
jgi:hypothetical protein